jgi:hypothetical protein
VGNALQINKNPRIFPIDEASAFCFACERRMQRAALMILSAVYTFCQYFWCYLAHIASPMIPELAY